MTNNARFTFLVLILAARSAAAQTAERISLRATGSPFGAPASSLMPASAVDAALDAGSVGAAAPIVADPASVASEIPASVESPRPAPAFLKSEPGHATQNFAMIGAGVMGKGVVLRAAEGGFRVAVYDLNLAASRKIADEAPDLDIIAVKDLAELVASLQKPRRIMMLVPDGKPVDGVLSQLAPLLEPGDVIIESANSFFEDSRRREKDLARKGILYVPMGISGGERGARSGPSLMPGGTPEAYAKVADVLTAIAGAHDGEPAAAWMGNGPAGHYVKMVHNGIEYAEMQHLAETYDLFKRSGMSTEEISAAFGDWNKTEASSFLLGTAAKVLSRIDPETGNHLVDMILDKASQKGTGRNTQIESLKLGAGSPTIGAAIEARSLSSFKEQRQELSHVLAGPAAKPIEGDARTAMVADAKNAFYAAKFLAFEQGFSILRAGSKAHGFGLDLARIAQVWRAGCILQSRMINTIADRFKAGFGLDGLLSDPQIRREIAARHQSIRNILKLSIDQGVPAPALSASLAYYDSLEAGAKERKQAPAQSAADLKAADAIDAGFGNALRQIALEIGAVSIRAGGGTTELVQMVEMLARVIGDQPVNPVQQIESLRAGAVSPTFAADLEARVPAEMPASPERPAAGAFWNTRIGAADASAAILSSQRESLLAAAAGTAAPIPLSDRRVQTELGESQQALREILKLAIDFAVPVPALSSALAYYDAFRSETLPANFIQALRDYFGAHRYTRIDKPADQTFHDPTWENESGR
jgi:6-phosphogluconate dehydrogenase